LPCGGDPETTSRLLGNKPHIKNARNLSRGGRKGKNLFVPRKWEIVSSRTSIMFFCCSQLGSSKNDKLQRKKKKGKNSRVA
jgi:hypothetical protein